MENSKNFRLKARSKFESNKKLFSPYRRPAEIRNFLFYIHFLFSIKQIHSTLLVGQKAIVLTGERSKRKRERAEISFR